MVSLIKNAEILEKRWNGYEMCIHDIICKDGIVVGKDISCTPQETVDAKGNIVLPQLFNIHCHLGESLYRIEEGDWTITKYLDYTSKLIHKQTKEEADREWALSADFAVENMVRNGIIGFCAGRSAEIAKKNNLCTMAGYPLMFTRKLENYYRDGLAGYVRYYNDNASDMCLVGVLLHSLYMSDRSLLELAQKCMNFKADFLAVHVSEDLETRIREMKIFGDEPIFVLDKMGLLGEKTILVHCGYISDNELRLVAKRNATIAVCPISNRFLNTKMINILNLEKYGVRWCISTDGYATGRSFSLFDQIIEFKRKWPQIANERIWESVTVTPAGIFQRSAYKGGIEKGVISSFIMVQKENGWKAEECLENFFRGHLSWKAVRL